VDAALGVNGSFAPAPQRHPHLPAAGCPSAAIHPATCVHPLPYPPGLPAGRYLLPTLCHGCGWLLTLAYRLDSIGRTQRMDLVRCNYLPRYTLACEFHPPAHTVPRGQFCYPAIPSGPITAAAAERAFCALKPAYGVPAIAGVYPVPAGCWAGRVFCCGYCLNVKAAITLPFPFCRRAAVTAGRYALATYTRAVHGDSSRCNMVGDAHERVLTGTACLLDGFNAVSLGVATGSSHHSALARARTWDVTCHQTFNAACPAFPADDCGLRGQAGAVYACVLPRSGMPADAFFTVTFFRPAGVRFSAAVLAGDGSVLLCAQFPFQRFNRVVAACGCLDVCWRSAGCWQ